MCALSTARVLFSIIMEFLVHDLLTTRSFPSIIQDKSNFCINLWTIETTFEAFFFFFKGLPDGTHRSSLDASNRGQSTASLLGQNRNKVQKRRLAISVVWRADDDERPFPQERDESRPHRKETRPFPRFLLVKRAVVSSRLASVPGLRSARCKQGCERVQALKTL